VDDLQLLEEMLRVRSLSRQEGALAELLRGEMVQRGFRAGIDAAGNVVGEIGADGGPTILLLGHMDTVAGEVPVRIEDDVLFGRGAVDAKGPLAAFVAAATGFRGPGRVIVAGVVEEEAATSRGARHLLDSLPQPDYAVIGEPSNWDRVTIGYKGRLLAEYRIERSMAHTAAAQAGACETAVDFWRAVQQAAAALNAHLPDSTFERLQPSLRAMRSSSDGLTEQAELELGFRLPPGFDRASWERTLARLADAAAMRCHAYEPAVRVEKNTALARAFVAAIRAAQGRPRFVIKTGTSDLNVIATRWTCPMLAYGPGDSAYDHTPDEQISLVEYRRGIDVLHSVIGALAVSGVPA
jgi:LysW-gamma-L-lysine carboxypeptidase